MSRPKQRLDAAPFSHFKDNHHDIELYFNAVFNHTGDPIFIEDKGSRMLVVNDAFCKLFGIPRDEIIGKTLVEKLPSSEIRHFLSTDRQVLEDGKEVICE